MRLASMAGMQVDPVPEECFREIYDSEAADPESSVRSIAGLADENGLSADVMEEQTSEGLARFVQFVQSRKRQKDKKSVLSRAIHAYEAQRFMEESNETVGMRLNKAS